MKNHISYFYKFFFRTLFFFLFIFLFGNIYAQTPPESDNDSYSTNEDVVLSVNAALGVLANDAADNPITALLETDVIYGDLTLNADGSFTYDPQGTLETEVTFTYYANDGSQNGNEATVTITINQTNDAPVSGNDGYTVNEDNVLTVSSALGVLSNDEDDEGSPLSAILGDDVAYGDLSLNADGSFTYDPQGTLETEVTFTYYANDGSQNGNEATVTITINQTNDVPVSGNDGYTVNEDNVLTVSSALGVLSNDEDDEGSPLSAVLGDDVAYGDLSLNADGSFTYDPQGTLETEVTFTYYANDGSQNGNEAIVTITINQTNDAPVSGDDSYSVDENGTLTVPSAGVLANDTDEEGDDLTVALVDSVSYGELILNTNGGFVYNHNGANFEEDEFTYVANDGTSNGNVATVTITVNQLNDPPVSQDDSYSVNEGDTLVRNALLGVLWNDIDDENEPFTEISLFRDVVNGYLTLNDNGSFEYIHDGSETLADSFIYQVSDGAQLGNQATVRITVISTNDAPISVDNEYNLSEGGTREANVLLNDSDPDGDDIDAILIRNVTHGELNLNSEEGTFVYMHDGSESTLDSFTYRANDGMEDGNLATVRFIIEPENDPPYFQNFSQITRYEGSDTTFRILSDYVIDDDSPLEGLTFSIVSPSPTNIDAYIIEDTLFIATIDENWFGTEDIYININDNDPFGAETTRDTISINVINVDDYPRFTVDTIHVSPTDEDANVAGVVLNLNTYVIELDNDSVMLQAPNDPIFSFTASFEDPRYAIEATIPENWNGERYLNFYIVDDTPQGLRDTIVFHYTINPVDDPPYVENPIANLEVNEDADDVVYYLHDVFEDIDNADEEMEFDLHMEDNEFMQAYISEDELVVTFLKDSNSEYGSNPRPDITITCLSNNSSVIEQFNVYVWPVNDPPTFTISGDVIFTGNEERQEKEVKVYPDLVPADEKKKVIYSLDPSSVDFATVTIDTLKGDVKVVVEAGAKGSKDFRIIAFDGEKTAEQTFWLSIMEKVVPEIIFTEIPDKTLSDSIVLLEASTSSDTTISFSIVSGEAFVSNDTLFITGAGNILVKASCPETNLYKAAEQDRRFYVEELTQEITFEPLPDRVYGDDDFVIHVSASSGLGVFFDIEGPLLVVDDSTMQISGVGEVKIAAYQMGNSIYAPSDTVSRTFQIHKADQTIEFDALESQIYSPTPISLSAYSSSGLPVDFTVVSGSADILGNLLYVTGAGYITVRSSQSGSNLYKAATNVEQTFKIDKATQEISFEPLTNTSYSTFKISLNATTTSDLTPEFDWEGPVEINDTLLSITGTGTAYVSAYQPGDERYLPTDTITRSFVITKAEQQINLEEPDPIIYGIKSIAISAEASSGLELRFEVLKGSAIAEDSIIIPEDYGLVVFRVSQEGDENYESAFVDYEITFVEAVPDISIDLLTPSLSQVLINRPTAVIVRIKNTGNRDISSFTISYFDDKGSTPDIISESYPYLLFIGDSIDYSFSTDWTPREESKELCVYLQSADDVNSSNDTACLPLSTSVIPLSHNKDLISNVYPNPSNNFVYFSLGNNIRDGRLMIYNSSGATIEQFKINTDANKLIFEVDINNYRQGTYYYRFINNKEFASGKFVVY